MEALLGCCLSLALLSRLCNRTCSDEARLVGGHLERLSPLPRLDGQSDGTLGGRQPDDVNVARGKPIVTP